MLSYNLLAFLPDLETGGRERGASSVEDERGGKGIEGTTKKCSRCCCPAY